MAYNKAILAGIFTRSNMGIARPSVDDIAHCMELEDMSLRRRNGTGHDQHSAMEHFCGHLIESDEMENMFRGEADMWMEYLTKKSDEEIKRVHGDIIELYEAAEQVNSDQPAPISS